jgi:hypothetical protein
MDGLVSIGRWLVVAGLVLAVVGGLVWLVGRFSGLNNLPGTLRITLGGATCVIPILGSIILSIVLTLVLNLVVRLLNR